VGSIRANQTLEKEGSSFSEEKEAKRLLILDAVLGVSLLRLHQETKVFCFFFSKKQRLPSLAPPAPR
jgi:hypothetical protein